MNLFVLRFVRCKLAFLSIILYLLVTLKAIQELPGVHRPHWLFDSYCTEVIVEKQRQRCQSCAHRSAPLCFQASHIWAGFAKVDRGTYEGAVQDCLCIASRIKLCWGEIPLLPLHTVGIQYAYLEAVEF